MRAIKHKRCLIGIMIIFIIGNLYLANSLSEQVRAVNNIGDNNKKLIEKIKSDQAISDSIVDKIEQKQNEVLSMLKSGDLETLKLQTMAIKDELSKISNEFSSYKTLHEQNKISQSELEQRLVDTQSRLSELDAKLTVLQTAISTLDGSIQDRIRVEIGDIETLKEQIKQELIQELSE